MNQVGSQPHAEQVAKVLPRICDRRPKNQKFRRLYLHMLRRQETSEAHSEKPYSLKAGARTEMAHGR
jgi:hypothetical protein